MRRLSVCLSGLGAALLCASSAAAQPAAKTVLAVYSQDRDSAAIGTFDQGVRKALGASSASGMTLYSEFLDSYRFPGAEHLTVMHDYLRRKYAARHLDAIIIVGRSAADTVFDRRDPLFPDVPAVSYSLDQNDLDLPARALDLSGTFGRNQRQTLDLALALHPDTQQVFVVVQSPPGAEAGFERTMRRELADVDRRVQIEYLTDLHTGALIARLQDAGEHSLVLYIRQIENVAGQRANPQDILPVIAAAVNLPIYGGYDTYLGQGVAGGYLYSSQGSGVATGELVRRIANGEQISGASLQVPSVATFDWRELRRWGIAESQLPAGSVILFREPTFWVQYRRYAIGGLTIVALQFALISTLLAQRRRRRRAEHALRAGEERYRRVVEAQSDLICRFRPDTTLTFVNDAYCRFLGKNAGDLIGQKMLDQVPPAARASVGRYIAAMAASPGTHRYEHKVLSQDGSVCCLEWIHQTLLDQDGRIQEVLGTGRDITDRKRAEDALRDSEARNGALLRAMPDLLFVMSDQGVYLDYHARDQTMLYVPPQQFIGKSIYDVMPPELAAIFGDALAAARHSGEPSVVEYSLPIQGEYKFFEARLVAFEPDQMLSVVRDMTEQKRTEARLRVSEDRYSLATSAGGVGVWDWSIENQDLYVDPAVLSILGRNTGNQADRRVNWRELIHPQDQARAEAAANDYLDGLASHFEVELRLLHRDGGIRWFHARGSAVRKPDGALYRVVGTLTDVTDRKQAEILLKEQEAVLRGSYAEIRDLAGRLIEEQETERKRLARELHDNLSQKVALLSIGIEQLRKDAPDFPTRVRDLSESAADIATDVHELSHRLHSFKLEALGLVPAIQGVCREMLAQHGLAVEFQHDSVPATLPPDVALCLFRIVQEGLNNVVKHSRAERVWMYLGRADDDLALQIADSGVGFVLSEHERSGLGLVSMRERVNFLGGQLVIHSAPGVGTRIGVRVPLASPRSDGEAAAERQYQPAELRLSHEPQGLHAEEHAVLRQPPAESV